ncbi:phosphatidylinositol N-acetylglucosaminyltransferase subunit C-like [Oppia nitens]|uniref:phosphatidylinositol N-acetylglucosaminyltransferase subunit C-like n=1 Tax=Oppia nitens TaxID=1686743 RepID=UPI0023DA3A54|nr:phosphatidylinositol N-acetylglucosaminyltransferase subunit C-like [Oppia nitens]
MTLATMTTTATVAATTIKSHHKEAAAIGSGGGDQHWKKVLYSRQGVADHYVPPSFLQDLRKNVNLQKYELKDCILSSTALTQEMCSIIIFIVVFLYLDSGRPQLSIYTGVTIVVITLFLYSSLILSSPSNDVLNELKSAAIFLISGLAVSPILKTLTETVSTDTIYAMVTIMMLVHLTFYDYGAKAAIVSTPVALNAAIFGGVCLASRLSTTYDAFALLIFASDIFVLSSILRRRVQLASDNWRIYLTVVHLIISAILLYTACPLIYLYLFILLLVCINFICPLGFYRCQKYKENIYGPWDEAVIDETIDDETSAATDHHMNDDKRQQQLSRQRPQQHRQLFGHQSDD